MFSEEVRTTYSTLWKPMPSTLLKIQKTTLQTETTPLPTGRNVRMHMLDLVLLLLLWGGLLTCTYASRAFCTPREHTKAYQSMISAVPQTAENNVSGMTNVGTADAGSDRKRERMMAYRVHRPVCILGPVYDSCSG
ncbi:hypothetical protein J6590_037250 [Homalodisca vitripennis]|nr:hypothetical protein J6590_037250 [Homalodisca vitripennis]